MSDQWTLFAEGSLARTSPPQDVEKASKVPARDYGASTPVLLARYDPDTSLWRTSQHSLEGGLTEFSETFPRSGTMRSGTAYRLPPLVRLTAGTGFGLLPTHSIPTPTASDHIERKPTRQDKAAKFNPETGKAVSLDRFVAMYPTPTDVSKGGGSSRSGDRINETPTLQGMARKGQWPTPTSRDWKDGTAESCKNVSVNGLLGRAIHDEDQPRGSLNPIFVEWLMGFPLGFTDLEA